MSNAPFLDFTRQVSFLAPMQDITDSGFMQIVDKRGSPDFFIAEYFRIHEFFELDSHVLDSVLWSPDRVCAQFIGEDETFISRAIDELKKYPQIKMLDLNLGCPAPKVYKKNVGGGLLRDHKKIASIMRVMRSKWEGCFSVKMRTGFDSDTNFAETFKVVLDGSPDFISLHARTVKQLYKGTPNYDKIAEAVSLSNVPVIANGDIVSALRADEVVRKTGCAGVMVGRHAVRNPWIFRQIADKFSGRDVFVPTHSDVRKYVDDLLANIQSQNLRFPDSRLKKFLNFVGASIDPNGDFLFKMRRAKGIDELLKVCDEFMLENSNAEKPFRQEPYEGVCSRPNCEL
ncbi:MAG: tRNA-dihydrouridine synthase family protein [Opitutales bacterium]|nr:tRNA-dihydrouridine synthase family protein [Opitutales bacterium]